MLNKITLRKSLVIQIEYKMQANLSTLESLQADYGHSAARSPMAVFNVAIGVWYTGRPDDLSDWYSRNVYGKVGTDNVNYGYQILQTTDGSYALQKATNNAQEIAKLQRNGLIKSTITARDFVQCIVEKGDLDSMTAKHLEYTGQPPKINPQFQPLSTQESPSG